MCLKFLLEANPENQKLVGSLEARQVVPNGPSGKAELERMGVDVSLSEEGKVKVSGRSSGHSSARSASATARRNDAINRDRQREKVARERMEQLAVNDGEGEFDEEVDFM